jgi:hypothetical protein
MTLFELFAYAAMLGVLVFLFTGMLTDDEIYFRAAFYGACFSLIITILNSYGISV